jgi:hypothetical protein
VTYTPFLRHRQAKDKQEMIALLRAAVELSTKLNTYVSRRDYPDLLR